MCSPTLPSKSSGAGWDVPRFQSRAASEDIAYSQPPDPAKHPPFLPRSGPHQSSLALNAGEGALSGKPRMQTRPAPYQLHPLGGVGHGLEPPSFLAQVSSAWPTFCPQIQDSEHIKVENSEQGSKLTIRAARQEHCGCYTLLVENKLGSRQAQVNLTVVGESGDGSAEGRMVGFQASPLGYSPSTCVPSAHGLPFSPCSHTVAALPAC